MTHIRNLLGTLILVWPPSPDEPSHSSSNGFNTVPTIHSVRSPHSPHPPHALSQPVPRPGGSPYRPVTLRLEPRLPKKAGAQQGILIGSSTYHILHPQWDPSSGRMTHQADEFTPTSTRSHTPFPVPMGDQACAEMRYRQRDIASYVPGPDPAWPAKSSYEMPSACQKGEWELTTGSVWERSSWLLIEAQPLHSFRYNVLRTYCTTYLLAHLPSTYLPTTVPNLRFFEHKRISLSPVPSTLFIDKTKMMPSTFLGISNPDASTFSQHAGVSMEDLSRQMALSQASRRLSRGSNGQQRAGSAMRVVKPTSANTSPRSSSHIASRKRALMNDASLVARRRQCAVNQAILPAYRSDIPSHTRSSRPLSWHPSTGQQPCYAHTPGLQQEQYLTQRHFPVPAFQDDHDLVPAYQPQYSPVQAAYSCSASPSSAFSPLSLPFDAIDTTPYLPAEGWNLSQQSLPPYVSPLNETSYPELFPSLPASAFATDSSTQHEWGSFASRGFNSTSPPTPENLPRMQQPQPAVTTEESIPYQPLDEAEEEGEILVGMGLYDAPEKYDEDPHLYNSRSAMSSLLGSSYRCREGTGKGLKLEEPWQPPESDDEDQEQDADGEDQEEDMSNAA
ncbi:hypothetical protein SODALDRAFT_355367 [Sodiomyces alkalinus F11]|uniref:Uncharacterized protein n=1 Tax=Sodiomyces alkalinus (strain CBS 110278 / VKM F-3762 / F11) TaxID=1314773 RepID=A0A3N2Q8T8_SODAK|nr:hypothetical protein SODALDRAFT_355367 [Sodiomyces alkalinus F11]ROT43172.1 hypothetical protein SODALDRAFT_355367 [Sodiomyces alkalinus F11]